MTDVAKLIKRWHDTKRAELSAKYPEDQRVEAAGDALAVALEEAGKELDRMDCGHPRYYDDSYGGCIICKALEWMKKDNERDDEDDRRDADLARLREEVERWHKIADERSAEIIRCHARIAELEGALPKGSIPGGDGPRHAALPQQEQWT